MTNILYKFTAQLWVQNVRAHVQTSPTTMVDEVITTQRPSRPESWCRFRDDYFEIWTRSQDALITFTDFRNTIGQNLGWKTKLKFEVKFDPRKLDFLDISLHLYLLPSSNRPPNITLNIPCGVGLRLKRIYSENNRLDNRLDKFETYFLNRGYDGKHVDQEFSRVEKISREKTLTKSAKRHTDRIPSIQSAENRRKECNQFWLRLHHTVILISNDRTSASKKINLMALI